MKKQLFFLLTLLLVTTYCFSQKPQKLNSNEIYEKIEKLNFLGTALYIAAHPDDENTRLIAYLANHIKARTAYLSLTRGDGGQNLIGSEIRELLGVIRTQELLAARNVDGGEQFFTRANDFGYSKHPIETLQIWDKEKVLSDVVWTIRNFKPDVVINRFNHETPGTTHGHHTTSAMLSIEAFDKAGSKNEYPDQLKHTQTWQPKRLFYNTSSWFYKDKLQFKNATKNFIKLNTGAYYPLKGLSNNELASIASSQHLCQGFGRLTSRGEENEYLTFLKGEPLKDSNAIFSGINTTWNRIKGGGEIGNILYKIEDNFDFKNPSKHLPKLMEAYTKIKNLEDTYWQSSKEKQIIEIIEACAGLYLEASAVSASATPNSTIEIQLELINRSNAEIEYVSHQILHLNKTYQKNITLHNNKKITETTSVYITSEEKHTSPYWLSEKGSLGMYTVSNQQLIGLPETPNNIQIQFNLSIASTPISIVKNVVRRYAKRNKGELYEPFEILPKITTTLKNKVFLFSDDAPKKVSVNVRAGEKNVTGKLHLNVPKNWSVSPKEIPFSIKQKKDMQTVDFLVTPPKNKSEGTLQVVATSNGKTFEKELVEINYQHIPKQSVLLNSEAKLVRLTIEKVGTNIGYIKGAGDAVPESLRQIGYTVTEINPIEITAKNLHKFDAIILGIRAYNVVDELKFKQKFLLEYVKKGGNMIVQYNTNKDVDVAAPYQLILSRDRVTDENAEVKFLDANNPLVHFPNKISSEDFNQWVQERGLYFPNSWGKEFVPILSMNDKGETSKNGSLLIAKYGKGNYIYTGLSFFRELPAGVSGAYKLFANMLSAGKQNAKN